MLVSCNDKKLAEQNALLSKEYGISVHTLAIDLTKPDAADKVYSVTNEQGLLVDILVNNAGFNKCGSFLTTTMAAESSMIQLHAVCTTELMKLYLPAMVKNRFGRVVNLGSTGSYMACPNDAVYAATKAYILQVSKSINAELKGTGVTVTTLCPGSTQTAFASKAGMKSTLLSKFLVMDPEKVDAIGYRAMCKGRTLVIAGIYNKLLVFVSKITPSVILNPHIRKMLSKT